MILNLDFLQNKKEENLTKDFKEELSKYIEEKESMLEREEGLYQVVDFGNGSVFLQNVETNKIYEEKNMPSEIINQISNDYILKFENGKFTIEKELTDKFFNEMIDIKEYIKNKK